MKYLDYTISNKIEKNHCDLLPKSIRCCIIGESGCGKTNLLLNFLFGHFKDEEFLDYDNLIIVSTSIGDQGIFDYVQNAINFGLTKKEINSAIESNSNVSTFKNTKNREKFCEITLIDNVNDIPQLNEFDKNLKTIVVFDDCIDEKNQDNIAKFWSKGRHKNLDVFYLTQNYTKLSKNTIRQNTNFYILFEQSDLDLSKIFKDQCKGISKDEFKKLCNLCWKSKYSYVTIDKTSEKIMGRFRKEIEYFFIPD
jgi:hypothetical protein